MFQVCYVITGISAGVNIGRTRRKTKEQ